MPNVVMQLVFENCYIWKKKILCIYIAHISHQRHYPRLCKIVQVRGFFSEGMQKGLMCKYVHSVLFHTTCVILHAVCDILHGDAVYNLTHIV